MVNQSEMNELRSIKANLVHEFIEVSKKDGQLQNMDTLMHTIKNLGKVIKDCEEEEMGYSGYVSPMYSGGMPYYNAPYSGDYSGARGRGPQASRDSMGRYSSHGDFKASLYEAMNNARTDMERQQIQNLINQAG